MSTLRVGDAVVVRESGRCDFVQRQILLPALVPYCAALVAVRFGCSLAVPLALGDAWATYLGVVSFFSVIYRADISCEFSSQFDSPPPHTFL